jgi:hypothetical protein
LAIGFAAGLLIAYNVFDQHLKEVEAEKVKGARTEWHCRP